MSSGFSIAETGVAAAETGEIYVINLESSQEALQTVAGAIRSHIRSAVTRECRTVGTVGNVMIEVRPARSPAPVPTEASTQETS